MICLGIDCLPLFLSAEGGIEEKGEGERGEGGGGERGRGGEGGGRGGEGERGEGSKGEGRVWTYPWGHAKKEGAVIISKRS